MIGFWIFMLIMDLLIPVSMIGFGSFFIKNAPREINFLFGYRTPMSMKNKETWIFAHSYCGRLWRIYGWVMLAVSIIAMLFMFGKDIDAVGIFGGILCLVQCVVMIIPIIFTEIALKKNFDKNGERKND